MNAIVSADSNWGIGLRGSLLVRIPADMKQFRQKTIGNVIVLGRKTLEGFPNGIPLQGRTNIILTHNPSFSVRGGIVVHSKEELFEELKKYDSESIYVVGGGSIYEMLLPYCDKAYVTRVDYRYEADTHFPDLDRMDNWSITEESEEETCFSIEYKYVTYTNSNPLKIDL
ncbi:MAG: dihydrofolate reductase [Eubacterium sp.]|nr:dihydrofolate reductase [Eubacterium sp.]